MNARYALNAANARWGSLYDALYGTDAIPEDGGAERGKGYNPVRGKRVIDFARGVLDEAAPLDGASWRDATGLAIRNGDARRCRPASAAASGSKDPQRLRRLSTASEHAPTRVLLRHHGLHLEILIDRDVIRSARHDPAGIADIVVEAAMTTIMDFEDSIAAVDAEDKVLAYRNWLGLMKGDLTAKFDKGGKTVTRALERRPRIQGARRRDAHAARPQPDARPQCRPPDDDRRRHSTRTAIRCPKAFSTRW